MLRVWIEKNCRCRFKNLCRSSVCNPSELHRAGRSAAKMPMQPPHIPSTNCAHCYSFPILTSRAKYWSTSRLIREDCRTASSRPIDHLVAVLFVHRKHLDATGLVIPVLGGGLVIVEKFIMLDGLLSWAHELTQLKIQKCGPVRVAAAADWLIWPNVQKTLRCKPATLCLGRSAV